MTINELIDQLAKIPEERHNEEVKVYVNGRLSGILQINHLEPDCRLSNGEVRAFIHTTSTWEYSD